MNIGDIAVLVLLRLDDPGNVHVDTHRFKLAADVESAAPGKGLSHEGCIRALAPTFEGPLDYLESGVVFLQISVTQPAHFQVPHHTVLPWVWPILNMEVCSQPCSDGS